jgi:hypothetical protein
VQLIQEVFGHLVTARTASNNVDMSAASKPNSLLGLMRNPNHLSPQLRVERLILENGQLAPFGEMDASNENRSKIRSKLENDSPHQNLDQFSEVKAALPF